MGEEAGALKVKHEQGETRARFLKGMIVDILIPPSLAKKVRRNDLLAGNEKKVFDYVYENKFIPKGNNATQENIEKAKLAAAKFIDEKYEAYIKIYKNGSKIQTDKRGLL